MEHICKAQKEPWRSSPLRPLVPCWVQTLQDMMKISFLTGMEQLHDPNVLDAKVKSEMCPALVELVCEALKSSGSQPKRV